MNYLDYILNNYFVIDLIWIVSSFVFGWATFRALEGKKSTRKRIYAGVSTFYMMLVLFYTVISRQPTGTVQYEFIPFFSYFTSSGEQIILNYIMFIPLGFMLPRLHSYKNTVKASLIFSVIIEVLQLVTTRGCFEIDDIIGNTIGAFLGCIVLHQWRKFKTKQSHKHHHRHSQSFSHYSANSFYYYYNQTHSC